MAYNASAMRFELLSGPAASVYSAWINPTDVGALTMLVNAVSAPATTVVVGLVSALALQESIVASEYLGLAVPQRDLWNALLTCAAANGVLTLSNTLIRTQVGAVWSAATTTRSNLSNLQTRGCTRVEALFGEGTVVDQNAIYYALSGVF